MVVFIPHSLLGDVDTGMILVMISIMLKSRLTTGWKNQSAFALPTVLIASVVMLIVLLSSVSAASSVRVALDEQFYNKLAQEAGEAGLARADACLEASAYNSTWTDASRLRPDTTCTGASIAGGNKYIASYGNLRTTFEVLPPVIGSSSSAQVTVIGKTELVRTSLGSVYQTYTQTIGGQSRYADAPKIAGGAGWKGTGHLGAVMTANNQLYGYGANVNGQIVDSKSPASVLLPTVISLPAGVTSVNSVVTSGQGASIMCIMANTAQVWCRGAAGAAEDGLMPATVGWQRFGLPAGLTAVSMSISGYGPDAMCVLASDGQGYCAGENYYGSLGNNNTAYVIYKIGNPQKFRLDIPAPGASLRKIYTQSDITCGITTTDDMYCAGLNWDGQIAGPLTNGTGNGVYASPIRYPIPGARKVDDVSVTYHTLDGHPVTHVLATDGTIWGSGSYADGDLGNGTTAGSTGSSQTPALFTHADAQYATGSIFWNAQASKCIDNDANQSTNGNIIHLWTCGGTGSGPQTWVYGKNKQITNLGTGKCLDVPGNNPARGALMQLYDCNNSAAQQFDLISGTIVHISSGLCLDAINNGTANGTRIQTWTCGAGNPAQSFTTWAGINGWRGMITGTNHFCGLRSDSWSGMWCAGNNTYGQLANWSSTNNFLGQCQANPAAGHSIFNVNLPDGEKVDVTKLTDEWSNQFLSTMVISTTGKVYGSGRNEFGKLGNGTLGDSANGFRECVVKEFALPTGVTAMDMSTRDEYTTYVLGSDGRIYSAGQNNLGQLGDGTTTNRSTPVEVKIPRQAILY
jgi:alpha-tubulin suppressor-like RCC1 family protein